MWMKYCLNQEQTFEVIVEIWFLIQNLAFVIDCNFLYTIMFLLRKSDKCTAIQYMYIEYTIY